MRIWFENVYSKNVALNVLRNDPKISPNSTGDILFPINFSQNDEKT